MKPKRFMEMLESAEVVSKSLSFFVLLVKKISI